MRPATISTRVSSPALLGLTYVTDQQCHNSESGFFDHECREPAVWIGTKPNGYRSGFCDHCKRLGREATEFTTWEPAPGLGGAA